jgi:hypothetical protein
MRNMTTRILMAISLVFALTVPALATQEEAPAAEAQESMTISGELLRVDPDAQTFTVADAEGNEVQFTYNDWTQVSGGEGTIAGLDAETGAQVTVHYTDDGSVKHATRIELQG